MNTGKEKIKSSSENSNGGDKEESKEADYGKYKDQLEKQQEEETEEITTTNQVFEVKKYLDEDYFIWSFNSRVRQRRI
ncbi:MAG: hypothetical protein ACJ71K_14255 [Nitrososphaeraceae archaeon]|jgi:hypothetical protein